MYSFHLQLFLAGKTRQSAQITASIEGLCREFLGDHFTLELVDVLQHPDVTKQAEVLMVPALLKQTAHMTRPLIGDLMNRESVLKFLEDKEGGAEL